MIVHHIRTADRSHPRQVGNWQKLAKQGNEPPHHAVGSQTLRTADHRRRWHHYNQVSHPFRSTHSWALRSADGITRLRSFSHFSSYSEALWVPWSTSCTGIYPPAVPGSLIPLFTRHSSRTHTRLWTRCSRLWSSESGPTSLGYPGASLLRPSRYIQNISYSSIGQACPIIAAYSVNIPFHFCHNPRFSPLQGAHRRYGFRTQTIIQSMRIGRERDIIEWIRY